MIVNSESATVLACLLIVVLLEYLGFQLHAQIIFFPHVDAQVFLKIKYIFFKQCDIITIFPVVCRL